jgi:hypothetical protein
MLTRPAADAPTHAPDAPVSASRRRFRVSRATVATVLLFALFFGGYFAVAARIVDMPVAKWRSSPLFHADPVRAIRSLTGPPRAAEHERTNVHPLFSIAYNPLGSALAALLGSPARSVALMVAACGALGVALARAFFSRAGFGPLDATLLAAILGVTSSHAFFTVVPETYVFTATTLVAMYWALVRGVRSPVARGAIHLLAFGNLITNVVQSAIVTLFSHGPRPLRRSIPRAALFCGAVVLVAAALSLVQLAIYPTSTLFFAPASLLQEQRFLADATGLVGLERAASLALHMFVYSFAAPTICVVRDGWRAQSLPVVTFDDAGCTAHETVGPLGPALTLLWLGLVAVAAASLAGLIRRGRAQEPGGLLVACLALSVAAHFGLHMLYGDSLFLYSMTWTFEILALVALLVRRLAARTARGRLAFRGALVAMLVLSAAHSAMFVGGIVDIYARVRL